jgi:serine protease AprX
MRPRARTATCSPPTCVLASAPLATASASGAAPQAPVQGWLQDRLAGASPTRCCACTCHADTAQHARTAAERSGLRIVEVFDKVGIAVAQGTPAQVLAARTQPSVSYVEGDRPAELLLDTSNQATRGAEAVATVDGPDGSDLDGSGVSIAIIDSGIDGTHPFFRGANGKSTVVRNLKSGLRLPAVHPQRHCFVDVPATTRHRVDGPQQFLVVRRQEAKIAAGYDREQDWRDCTRRYSYCRPRRGSRAESACPSTRSARASARKSCPRY